MEVAGRLAEARSSRRGGVNPPRPDARVYKDDAGGWRWRMRAANGEIVAGSESYTRRYDALRGLEDARSAFRNAVYPENGETPVDEPAEPPGEA